MNSPASNNKHTEVHTIKSSWLHKEMLIAKIFILYRKKIKCNHHKVKPGIPLNYVNIG